ncbi:MAG: hypothetical protein K0R39_2752 [Symbiobacteriaceae bacterium]|jgi:hypothetical protein|nr:hypothetical protein [Symbiobacteriaceae bacterium]
MKEDSTAAAVTLGYWSALLVTIAGFAYLAVISYLMATGSFTLPLPEAVEIFAAAVTIAAGPLLVAALVAVHYLVPAGRRTFSQMGVLFATVFMVMVSINRFVQLTVIRPSLLEGNMTGLERFMPYGPRSAMLSLELVGWGFFLGLGLLSAAFAFAREGVAGKVRCSFLGYAVLALASTMAFVADSPLSAIGFVAWGLILPIGTTFLTTWFARMRNVRR